MTLQIRITGVVQGVGFRPFIWQLANHFELTGKVYNDNKGVLVIVCGKNTNITNFIKQIKKQAPPLAVIKNIYPKKISQQNYTDFKIIKSITGTVSTDMPADTATCSFCIEDIFDENNPRYMYPFTNCTHCGPRISIIKKIPYDRQNTSMADFKMCDFCKDEYDDPTNRRFHAQPVACDKCGPQVFLYNNKKQELAIKSGAIKETVQLLQQGKIVAIKGLGGFTLCVDATNKEAVAKLRYRKQREAKALALLAQNSKMVEEYAIVTKKEKELLYHLSAPIVLCKKKKSVFSKKVAPDTYFYGFCLPSTPLHHIIMKSIKTPLVYTSANISSNPQIIENNQAQQDLKNIADYFLIHDREIVNRLDDSVLQVIDDQNTIIRRARGFAPLPISLHSDFKNIDGILAIGADKKNTFCMIKKGNAILSPHIGSLWNINTFEDLKKTLSLYRNLYDFKIKKIICDLHPQYVSCGFADKLAKKYNVPIQKVQHHHAHLVSVIAEREQPKTTEKYLGIALDGLGFGDDGTFWGGEFMLFNYNGYKRVAKFSPIPLVGGDLSAQETWRNCFAYLYQIPNWQDVFKKYKEQNIIKFLSKKPLNNIQKMITKNINCPLSSSAGRLFDAIAAFLDLKREKISFEAQAAIALENMAFNNFYDEDISAYDVDIRKNTISWQSLFIGMLEDSRCDIAKEIIATKALKTICDAIVQMTITIIKKHKIKAIVLSGGVWQNNLIRTRVCKKLTQQKLKILVPYNVPCNDGGLSLGQALIGN
jgi:hydrogenase maturation protein HypF